MDYFKESVKLHEKLKGKIAITNKMDVESKDDLSLNHAWQCQDQRFQLTPSRPDGLSGTNGSHPVEAQRSAVD